MALTTCRECQAEISDKAQACPRCGAPQSNYTPPGAPVKSGGLWWKALLGMFGLVVLFLVFGSYQNSKPENAGKFEARDAIALCWSEQGKKSLSANSQQFIAGACEKMERDFTQKYGVRP